MSATLSRSQHVTYTPNIQYSGTCIWLFEISLFPLPRHLFSLTIFNVVIDWLVYLSLYIGCGLIFNVTL